MTYETHESKTGRGQQAGRAHIMHARNTITQRMTRMQHTSLSYKLFIFWEFLIAVKWKNQTMKVTKKLMKCLLKLLLYVTRLRAFVLALKYGSPLQGFYYSGMTLQR